MTRKEYCEQITRQAKAAGIGLRMAKTPDGWSWEWSHGDKGHITAHTQDAALVAACEAFANPIVSARSFTV